MNKNKGFAMPLLLGIIAILIVGGGVYIYNNEKVEAPVVTPSSDMPKNNPSPSTRVSLDMTSEYAKTYKTIFTAEFSKPANFDGNLRLVPVGCGTQCVNLYALDKNNGQVYFAAGTNGDYEIVNNNQIRTTLNGQNVIYMFNPLKGEFEVQYV